MSPANTDSLEVTLAFQTPSCRTCSFFWPTTGSRPYGPYSTFDFGQNFPQESAPPASQPLSFPWATGTSASPGFPAPEIMDGCRKAPIMTIGINPNLTSFFPGPTGASWAYPWFSSDAGSDATTKYAYYYRYRSLYQEHFDPAFIRPFLLTDGQVVAADDGKVGAIAVNGLTPPIELTLEYTGSTNSTKMNLDWVEGQPPYVVLLNSGSTFSKGDIIAAKLSIPPGKTADIDRQVVGYYAQFVPVAANFSSFLQQQGIAGAAIRMGEDVCQLDMVACASPHWGPQFLGGSVSQENKVISNCVTSNSWVIKQLVQTRPVVLYIVGESSYDMFKDNLGNHISCPNPVPDNPADGAFTLLRLSVDPANPITLNYTYSNGANTYSLNVRLVISPHFSFPINFVPQFRFSDGDLLTLQNTYQSCYNFLKNSKSVSISKQAGQTYTAFTIKKEDAQQLLDTLKASYATAYPFLESNYYDPHAMLATVLADEYQKGGLAWTASAAGQPGYLSRSGGPCNFCVNAHWSFPQGCPYGKDKLQQPPQGFLAEVAADMVSKGKPAGLALRSYAEKMPFTADGKILL